MSTPRPKKKLGPVALVAAGPGDPELLTLRAAELLRSAARIIADFDAVELARPFVGPDAELVAAVDARGLPLDHAGRAKLVMVGAPYACWPVTPSLTDHSLLRPPRCARPRCPLRSHRV